MTDTVLEPQTPPAADPAPAGPPPAADPPAADPKPAGGDTPPASQDGSTLLDGGDTDPKNAPPADWPSDWQEKLAGGDEKLLKLVKRFGSPKGLLDKVVNQEKLISSGAYKKAMPGDGAKSEEIAEWRRQNDIPESHDKYDLKLEDGLVIGEQDKEGLNAVLQVAHAEGASQKVVNAIVNAHFKNVEAETVKLVQANEDARSKTEDALRAEWGPDYRRNITIVGGFLDTAPAGVKDLFLSAKLPNGVALLNSPDLMRFLAQQAQDLNPAVSVMPGAMDAKQSMDEEIASLEGQMSADRKAWFKNDKGRARLHELYAARDRYNKK